MPEHLDPDLEHGGEDRQYAVHIHHLLVEELGACLVAQRQAVIEPVPQERNGHLRALLVWQDRLHQLAPRVQQAAHALPARPAPAQPGRQLARGARAVPHPPHAAPGVGERLPPVPADQPGHRAVQPAVTDQPGQQVTRAQLAGLVPHPAVRGVGPVAGPLGPGRVGRAGRRVLAAQHDAGALVNQVLAIRDPAVLDPVHGMAGNRVTPPRAGRRRAPVRSRGRDIAGQDSISGERDPAAPIQPLPPRSQHDTLARAGRRGIAGRRPRRRLGRRLSRRRHVSRRVGMRLGGTAGTCLAGRRVTVGWGDPVLEPEEVGR